MNPEVLKAFSPSAQRVLRALAGSPGDASHFYDRLTIVRAALKIGVEVMEKARTGDKQADDVAKVGAMYALGTVTAIECCMTTLESLHPSLGKANASQDAPKGLPGLNGNERIRRLDLD
jgi:hypothetical protein